MTEKMDKTAKPMNSHAKLAIAIAALEEIAKPGVPDCGYKWVAARALFRIKKTFQWKPETEPSPVLDQHLQAVKELDAWKTQFGSSLIIAVAWVDELKDQIDRLRKERDKSAETCLRLSKELRVLSREFRAGCVRIRITDSSHSAALSALKGRITELIGERDESMEESNDHRLAREAMERKIDEFRVIAEKWLRFLQKNDVPAPLLRDDTRKWLGGGK